MKTMRILVVMIACVLVAGLAQADVWGVRVVPGAGNQLININPFTGVIAQTWVAPNSAPQNTNMGLAGWRDELFYTNADAENGKIYVIDPMTGATTRTFALDGGWAVDGLGYWSESAVDYLYTSGCSVDDVHRYLAADGADPQFYWSDVMNPMTIAGDNGGRVFTVGMNLQGQGRFGIWEMNPQVDLPATWFASSPSDSILGGAFDGIYLYLSDASGNLYTIDGSGNVVNTLGLDGYSLYALGSTEGTGPEPGTIVLFGLGLAGLASIRRKR